MITQERPNTVVAHGIKDTVSFGIKQEGLAHIFSVLRNQLYSDKILAVIREYTCNAVDAHTEAGKADEPIVVTLPSRFSPTFKVRDFGLGLTDEDIHDIYAFYGESTKRKSNAMIGQLGLGSKSAFAYGDNFVIVSYVNGVKNTYNAFIDASQIGQIAKLASEATNEPNGVEISIAVRDADTQAFHTKAYNLFRYFRVRPTVHGADFKYEVKTPIMTGKDWAVYGQGDVSTVAIMGNIGYPIDNHWNEELINAALSSGLEIQFNIGDLEISASREKLQYTDRTKKAIHDKLTRIVKEISDELNSRFQSCATLFDAHKLYGSVMDYSSPLYALRSMVRSSLQFNGKKIGSHDLRFNSSPDGGYSVRCYEPIYRNGKVKSWEYQHIDCNSRTVLILNDLHISSGVVNRVYNLVVTDQKKVYVISYRDDAQKQEFFKESGIVDANCILLSSLPKISLAAVNGNAVKNAKHASKEFSYDFSFKAGGWRHRKLSDYWQSETVDVANDSGVYVIIETFQYRDRRGCLEKPSELKGIVESLKVFGISIPKVYGFKAKIEQEVKDNPNMVCLWDYIAEQLTEYFAKNNIAQKIANRIEYDAHNGYPWLQFAMKNASKFDANSVLAKAAEVFEYMSHSSDKKALDTAVSWKEYFTATDKPEHDLGKVAKEVAAKYPLFEYIRYWENDKKQVASTVEYVNLVDG